MSLALVALTIVFPVQDVSVEDAFQHHEGADSVFFGEAIQFFGTRFSVVVIEEGSKRNKYFGDNMIAPELLGCAVAGGHSGIGQGACSQPYVSEFVDQSENQCGLGISAIDKDQGYKRVGQGETTELFGAEFAMSVRSYDPIDYYQHTDTFDAIDETA